MMELWISGYTRGVSGTGYENIFSFFFGHFHFTGERMLYAHFWASQNHFSHSSHFPGNPIFPSLNL